MNDDIELQPVVKRREQRFKLGIIGHGFVGKAVDYIFSTPMVDKFIVDPKYTENTVKDLCEWEPNCVFICAPTPSKEDGSVDSSIIDEAVMKLVNQTDAFIVIKSTLTPDVVDRLSRIDGRIVYHPEFLTEANAKMDMLEARYRVVGVQQQEAAQHLEGLYNYFSIANPAQMVTMSPVEAAFFKYAVNNYLAMKVTFMNQLKSIMDDYGGSYNQLSRALMADQRIGYSHMKIPGPDGKEGFGGACFPKDLSAFISFVDNKTGADATLLKTVKTINDEIRSQYELDEREKEQNVDYGQTEEEQQDKNDGSPSNI
jgi:UDPglucose 6-dehydrogenase